MMIALFGGGRGCSFAFPTCTCLKREILAFKLFHFLFYLETIIAALMTRDLSLQAGTSNTHLTYFQVKKLPLIICFEVPLVNAYS